jgi:hypothetical protein
MLLMLIACSDYNVVKNEDVVSGGDSDPQSLPGQAELSPGSANAIVCEPVDATFTVSNVGQGPLEVLDVELSGDGWTLGTVALPTTLAPDQELDIPVQATGAGTATLTVTTDDPFNVSLSSELTALADGRPSIELLEPGVDEILEEQSDLELVAHVSDDLSAPEDMLVTFTSSEAGALGTVNPANDGTARLTWAADDRPAGLQTITADVVDSCGLQEFDSAEVCQQHGYDSDELDIGTWNFEGDASWDSANSRVELTPLITSAMGSAFQTATTTDGSAISIRFEFYIGGGTGADGLAMTVLDTSRMTSYLGDDGGCLGYGTHSECGSDHPGLPGWSVEIDTYYNGHDPTPDDHVAVSIDGAVGSPVAWSSLPEMEDTGWHTFEAVLDAGHLTVEVDGVTYIDQSMSVSPFPAYVGFTAGTGALTNQHLIRSLAVTEYACAE